MIALGSEVSVGEPIDIYLGQGSVGIVYHPVLRSVRYAFNELEGAALGNFYYALLAFSSHNDIHVWTGLEDGLHVVSGLLSAYHGNDVARQGIDELADLREMVLPIDADAQ
jgi:hypothetical protein